ncbi:hypothetical protein V8G54_028554 [Vigna mungo]|uniref:Uncharacterized protein n=1 Tax=Vigna mungo TaxID=3915 RepID=A0AAQ3RKY7_VIGMU
MGKRRPLEESENKLKTWASGLDFEKKKIKNKENELKKDINSLKKYVAKENEARAGLEIDLMQSFNVNIDIFDGRMMDVDEIVATKSIKKTTTVEEVIDEDASKKKLLD